MVCGVKIIKKWKKYIDLSCLSMYDEFMIFRVG
jgi:hypothetical protein